MRILHNEDPDTPSAAPAGPAHIPAPSPGRLETLEHIVKDALQRLQGLEEKIDALGKAPKMAAPARTSEPPPLQSPSTLSPSETAALGTDALKKGLLTKMWKYMNDESPSKTA